MAGESFPGVKDGRSLKQLLTRIYYSDPVLWNYSSTPGRLNSLAHNCLTLTVSL
jgi:hypothetical protein